MRRAPGAERAAAGDLRLFARDVHDGMPVTYDGAVWVVWSKRGPQAGTCWLMRHRPDGSTETAQARLAALSRATR